jgi:long-chain acyl-CoA synthetase
VAQFADNSYDWIVIDTAIQAVQAVHVPLHATLSAAQAWEQIEHSGSKLVVLGDQQQADVLASVPLAPWDRCTWVTCQPLRTAPVATIHRLAELHERADVTQGQRLLERAAEQLDTGSLATILYTSGTTGAPKGVVLSHGNLVANTLATIEAFGIQPSDLRVCFLPLSHIFARTCDLYTWIARGSTLALAQHRETILQDCVRLGPTMLNGVPYFYQRVHRYLVEQRQADTPGSLQRVLGGQIRLCCCGGAALPDYLYDFFRRHEIPLLQGYGLTETSPVVTLNSFDHEKRGSVGRPVPGVAVRIAADGEILVRGPNVMQGYWRDDAATREVVRDGWLYTGDYGSLDDEGFLWVTGRKKDLIVTAAGKNVAPAYLERLLTEDPLIAQAVVVGDGRSYLAALIVPEPESLKKLLPRLRVLPLSKRWVLSHPRVRRVYRQCIDRRLAGVSRHEQIRRFYLMDRGFTFETGEMTPKLSLRRSLIQDSCAQIIEAMYVTRTIRWPARLATFIRSFLP